MTKRIIIVIFLAAIAMQMYGCRKTEAPTATYRGVVLYNMCGNVVIQSVGPYYLGQNNWTDSNNPSAPKYDHVFRVSNSCDFGTYSQGDSINFVLVGPKPQQCATCLLYVATPESSFAIRVIR